jgi:hemerythrin-like domain-containing protein
LILIKAIGHDVTDLGRTTIGRGDTGGKMGPLETLTNEHGLIRQYLDSLTLAAGAIEDGQRPSSQFFEKAVEFSRNFADTFHHFKEEHVLFVRLAQKCVGEIDAQLEALRFQHERGRALVTGMANAIEGYSKEDPNATVNLLQNIGAYASLLRHHIHIEDHLFYPMARKTLDAAEMRELETEFLKIQAKHGGDTFERSHKLVVDMGSILTHL